MEKATVPFIPFGECCARPFRWRWMMIMECHLWQCTGSTDSTIWLADTMTSTGCRCQTLRLMYAGILTARVWQNQEWIQRHCSTSWGIQIYRLQWMCTHISDSMMLRKNWNGWKSLGRRRRRLNRRKRNWCRRRCLRQFNMEVEWRSGLGWGVFCGKEVKMTI